jgi:hypothetical protein
MVASVASVLGDERLYTSFFLPFATLYVIAQAVLILCGSDEASITSPVVQWQVRLARGGGGGCGDGGGRLRCAVRGPRV